MLELKRKNRIPVSTIITGCMPFNIKQKSKDGYTIGEKPVKKTGEAVLTFETALDKLRKLEIAGWRDYGRGNNQGARQSIGWVTQEDAAKLFNEKIKEKRVALFQSLTDVVE